MCAYVRHKSYYMYYDARFGNRCKFWMLNEGSLENPSGYTCQKYFNMRSNELCNGLSNFSPFHIFVYSNYNYLRRKIDKCISRWKEQTKCFVVSYIARYYLLQICHNFITKKSDYTMSGRCKFGRNERLKEHNMKSISSSSIILLSRSCAFMLLCSIYGTCRHNSTYDCFLQENFN